MKAQQSILDQVGISLSTLCAFHCALTPFFALALPVAGTTLQSPWVHLLLAILILPVGIFAFWSGYQHHKKPLVLFLGVPGLLVITGFPLLADHAQLHASIFEAGFMIPASGLLILAHYFNQKYCRCHQH